MNRQRFLRSGAIGLSGLITYPVFGADIQKEYTKNLSIERIKEFVVAGHSNLTKVKEMLSEEPNLIYSSYDWGSGDFEEAIEGAGHVGNIEIANYLIEKGARVNLFVLTMLGKKNIVIPALQEYPSLAEAKGPHGFSLLHHARIGGNNSEEIYDFLLDKGLSETKYEFR
jgi:hypothetical protein